MEKEKQDFQASSHLINVVVSENGESVDVEVSADAIRTAILDLALKELYKDGAHLGLEMESITLNPALVAHILNLQKVGRPMATIKFHAKDVTLFP